MLLFKLPYLYFRPLAFAVNTLSLLSSCTIFCLVLLVSCGFFVFLYLVWWWWDGHRFYKCFFPSSNPVWTDWWNPVHPPVLTHRICLGGSLLTILWKSTLNYHELYSTLQHCTCILLIIFWHNLFGWPAGIWTHATLQYEPCTLTTITLELISHCSKIL